MTDEIEGIGDVLTCTVCNKVVLKGSIRNNKFICKGCTTKMDKETLKDMKAAKRAELDIKITERITLCKSKNWDTKICKNCPDINICKLI